MISIGAVYEGPELHDSSIFRAVSAARTVLKELRGDLVKGQSPWVNAVFVVPGSLRSVDFDGLQYGDYSQRDLGVVVKIAVPSKVLREETGYDFVVNALHGANAMAFEFFRQKGQSFPLRAAEDLVAQVAQRLVA